jgi:predicted nucleic acid-binding protein
VTATVKVLDASALVAVVFAEPGAEATARQLDGARLIAPFLIDIEVINICLVKLRRNLIRREVLPDILRLRAALRIELFDVDASEVLTLADATGLTSYDGCYLHLARKHSAELVTLDRKLAAAYEGGVSAKGQ